MSTLSFAAVHFLDSTMEDRMIHHIRNTCTLDIVPAKHPDAGICILGDVNHLQVDVRCPLCNNNRLTQVVKQSTKMYKNVHVLEKL